VLNTIQMYLKTVGLKGLLYAVKSKATKSTLLFTAIRNDCKHPIHLRICSTDIGAYQQVFFDKEFDFEVGTSPKVIVDAGANIGLASIYFANKYPDAKIIAIEPERSNFEILKMNVAPYVNVTPLLAALWHRNEDIDIIDPGLGHWGFMTESKSHSSSTAMATSSAVPGMTMDRLLAQFNIDTIDVLKVDIEGAEREVFSDTSAWIDRVGSIIVELHERLKAGCNRSFYCGSPGFDQEWSQGEKIYVSKRNCLQPHSR
jgi:FkbM family methyltransferase